MAECDVAVTNKEDHGEDNWTQLCLAWRDVSVWRDLAFEDLEAIHDDMTCQAITRLDICWQDETYYNMKCQHTTGYTSGCSRSDWQIHVTTEFDMPNDGMTWQILKRQDILTWHDWVWLKDICLDLAWFERTSVWGRFGLSGQFRLVRSCLCHACISVSWDLSMRGTWTVLKRGRLVEFLLRPTCFDCKSQRKRWWWDWLTQR